MLGIIITYFSCPEFLPFQLRSFKKFMKTPYKVLVVDDSEQGLNFDLGDASYIRTHTKINDYGPSGRHQDAVNYGIDVASKLLECTDFLIFDNDMIFLTDFNLPSESWYLPQQRGRLEYSWMNLIYLKNQTYRFDFAQCSITGERTDSGGNFKGQRIIKSEDRDDGFQYLFINDSLVVHFGSMSNWVRHSEEKYNDKKQRVIRYLNNLVLD